MALKYENYGLYCDYINFKCLNRIKEYAIDTRELSFYNIVKICVFNNSIDILDYVDRYFEDSSLKIYVFNNSRVVYDNGGMKYEKKLY